MAQPFVDPPWQLQLPMGTFDGIEIQAMMRQFAEAWCATSGSQDTLRWIRLNLDKLDEISPENRGRLWGWRSLRTYTEPQPLTPVIKYVLKEILVLQGGHVTWNYPDWMARWNDRWDEWQEAEWARQRSLMNPGAELTLLEMGNRPY